MSEAAEYAILTESLTKVYQHRRIALNCVDLAVEPGEVLGILGRNGAGKTTLVRTLLGLHVPTAGRAFVLGERMTPNAAGLRRRIGYLSADPKFPAGMTPIDYLEYVGRLSALPRTIRRPRVAALLRAVDLLGISGARIEQVSSGQRTRLAIAASLINDPEVLIWDEPSQGLDPDARRSMLKLMLQLAESKTLLLCSHNLVDLQEVCSRAVVLHEGQIVFDGPFDELRGQSKPSDIEITLVGDRKEIAETGKQLAQVEELESCELHKNLLRIRIGAGQSHATALANVLILVGDHNIEMADLRISGQQTEQAIIDLLIEEASRGLVRAHQPIAA